MKLQNFRELLLKKCDDDSLQNLIKFVREDVLTDLVIDSLEKMADAKHKGITANMALRNFGAEIDPDTHPDMIRDALGHHASRYKAAIADDRKDLANDHAKNFFNIVNTAHKAQKHSDGKLDVEAVSPHAWERNAKPKQYTEDHGMVQSGKRKEGDFVTDTKGWSFSGKDYSHLQQAPHDAYSNETDKHGHKDAFPMEHTRVNGKYISIEDIPKDQLKGKVEHEFDKHPIMSHGSQSASKRSPEDDVKYDKEAMDFEDSDHMGGYWDRHEGMKEADPKGYADRGSKPSDPVHKPIEKPMVAESKPESKPEVKATQEAATTKPDMTHEEFASRLGEHNLDSATMSRILAGLKSGK